MLFYTTRNLKPKRNEITLAQIVQDTARVCLSREGTESLKKDRKTFLLREAFKKKTLTSPPPVTNNKI